MKKILLTGGGTAGHVMPNLALVPHLELAGYHIDYIGSHHGIEKKLITDANIPYYGISSGKLRRYFDFKNFTDIFRIILGTIQATYKIHRLKPSVVFSKGGFVTVPVVIGAWLNRVPVVIHESDITPGLANRIALRFSKKIGTSFKDTLRYLPKDKGVYTGAPIRASLLKGNKSRGLSFTGLSGDKPILMVTGGSLGSSAINNAIRSSLETLLPEYDIVHLCGKGHLSDKHTTYAQYKQYEFIGDELSDLYAIADIVISRAGANTIAELLALHKPNILIPLPASQSRGDQLLNAAAYKNEGYSVVLEEERLDSKLLTNTIKTLYNRRNTFVEAMLKTSTANGTESIIKLIEDASKV